MAFTGAEFLRGGVWAIGIFIVALPWVTFIGSSSFAGESATPGRTEFAIVPYVMLLAGAIAGFVYVTYGSALAYLLGRALRSTRRRSVHRVCFAALGLLIGYVTLMLTDLAGITMVSGSAGAGPRACCPRSSRWPRVPRCSPAGRSRARRRCAQMRGCSETVTRQRRPDLGWMRDVATALNCRMVVEPSGWGGSVNG